MLLDLLILFKTQLALLGVLGSYIAEAWLAGF